MSKIELTFLGTACMMPTKDRNHQAMFLKYNEHGILLDCGENTQRQLKIAGIKPSNISKILISHWHGDHVLGLPGLLQSLNASEYTGKLEIYIPQGDRKYFDAMTEAFPFDVNIETEIIEFSEPGVIFENKDFKIEAFELSHAIKTFGFNFVEQDKRKIRMAQVKKLGLESGPLLGQIQRGEDIEFEGRKIAADELSFVVKGRKISYVADTAEANECEKMVNDADILVCESAFTTEHENKAEEFKHMTAKQAGLLASRSNAKKLILTHFSQRYKTLEPFLKDAKEVFENVECSYDFMKVKL